MTVEIIRDSTVNEDSTFVCLSRVTGEDGENITQSDVSTIERFITDLSKNTTGSGESVTVANAVFDSLQTDARWSKDNTGYNFRDTVPGTKIPDGDRNYRIEYKLTMASGNEIWVFFGIKARETHAA